MIVIVRSLRRRRTDLLDVGESTLDVGEQTVGETTRRRNDRNSNQHCETIYKNITHSYLQYSIIQVAATKLWAIKKPFEPAVLFSMSLSWMLWQYTKICLESFHRHNWESPGEDVFRWCGVDTRNVSWYYSAPRRIANTDTQDQFTKNFWRDSWPPCCLLYGWFSCCLFLFEMLSTRLSWFLKLYMIVFFQIWKSRLDIGMDALVREDVLTWISGNLIWILKKPWCISISFDINIWQFDMNIGNLIYKCIVDTWNWQSWYFVTFGQAYTGQSYPSFEQLHGCTSVIWSFYFKMKFHVFFRK